MSREPSGGAGFGRDPHRAMVSIYRYARRLSRHGGTPPPLVEELAQKAAFSREGVTSEECRQARKAACAEAERLYTRSLPGGGGCCCALVLVPMVTSHFFFHRFTHLCAKPPGADGGRG